MCYLDGFLRVFVNPTEKIDLNVLKHLNFIIFEYVHFIRRERF